MTKKTPKKTSIIMTTATKTKIQIIYLWFLFGTFSIIGTLLEIEWHPTIWMFTNAQVLPMNLNTFQKTNMSPTTKAQKKLVFVAKAVSQTAAIFIQSLGEPCYHSNHLTNVSSFFSTKVK